MPDLQETSDFFGLIWEQIIAAARVAIDFPGRSSHFAKGKNLEITEKNESNYPGLAGSSIEISLRLRRLAIDT
jgi:hypothetical protein